MPRVVVVDDSAYVRYVLRDRLKQRGWDVVGTAASGEEAVRVVPALDPDLVTMDVEMPGLSGIDTVIRLRRVWHGPLIMVSSLTQTGARATWDALAAGASDFVPKPAAGVPLDDVIATIEEKFQALAHVGGPMSAAGAAELEGDSGTGVAAASGRVGAVVIGASTGGPSALLDVLGDMPRPPSVPLVIVQHMPAGFTRSFAQRLSERAGFLVRECPPSGERLSFHEQPAVLAAGGLHLRMTRERCWMEAGGRVNGVIPAVDVTLADAVRAFGGSLAVVILTGMGEDGAKGAMQCRRAGGQVIAESQETALIWGMPRAVAECGAAGAVWPRGRIRRWLRDVVTDG